MSLTDTALCTNRTRTCRATAAAAAADEREPARRLVTVGRNALVPWFSPRWVFTAGSEVLP